MFREFFNLNKFQAVKFSTRSELYIYSHFQHNMVHIWYITCKKQIVLSILHHNQTPWDHNHLAIRHLMHRLRNLARVLLPHKTFQFHCCHHLAHHRIGYLKQSFILEISKEGSILTWINFKQIFICIKVRMYITLLIFGIASRTRPTLWFVIPMSLSIRILL